MGFLDREIDKKLFIQLLIIMVILVIVYLAFVMSSFLFVKPYKLGANTSIDDQNINTHIDVLEHDGKKLEIAGWAFKENEPVGVVKCNYVIKNTETNKMYLMKTKMEENINISEEEHKMAGIHAQCLLFGVPHGRYDIYVLYQNDDEDILKYTLIYVDI
jgi:hypothetical protein